MIFVGDIHVYVSDFERALRFWGAGLGLISSDEEMTRDSAFARLESPDGGPMIYLIGSVDPWGAGARPEVGARPMASFDITTTEFDETLARLLECGGTQEGEIELYNDLRVVSVSDPDGTTFDLLELPEQEEEAEE
jgi:predicted enzyme related to lactoylglutathione lyase